MANYRGRSSYSPTCVVCEEAVMESKCFHYQCNCYACCDCIMGNLMNNRINGRRNLECLSCPVPKRDDQEQEKLLVTLKKWAHKNSHFADILTKFENSLEDKDKTFCAHPPCTAGYKRTSSNRAMTCEVCKKKTCHNCKLPWHIQHKNTPCFKYKEWLSNNKPEWYIPSELEELCFICPNCRKQFEMVRGGCLHFVCPSCNFDFCGFCREPFHTTDRNPCTICPEGKQGMHAHHPRICPYYLRDKDVEWLWDLIKNYNKEMDDLLSPNPSKNGKCNVKYNTDKGVTFCENPVGERCQGFCMRHFKESVSGAIFRNKTIDPIRLMTLDELHTIAKRERIMYDESWDEKKMRTMIALHKPLSRGADADGLFKCPKCNTQHSVYRDGNYRFECPACYITFCGFCSKLYFTSNDCDVCTPDRMKGLHAHHPRICPYFVADQEVSSLWSLVECHNINMNALLSQNPNSGPECCYKYKDSDTKKEIRCSKSIDERCQGYCMKHFKLLVAEAIFKLKTIDPVETLTQGQLRAVLSRDCIPFENEWDSEQLKKIIKEQLPLKSQP